MKKSFNLEKEQYRGTIKQLMRVNGLRTINLSNYFYWKNMTNSDFVDISTVSTVKLNIQDGYLNMFDSNNNKIDDEKAASLYKNVYKVITYIIDDYDKIPYKIKRNILVKMNR